MDDFHAKLAAMRTGLAKCYFKIHFQIYLFMWHERPAFINLCREMCSWGFLSGSVLAIPHLPS